MSLKIERILATPVVVPPRPDSIMSLETEDDWSKSKGIGKTVGGHTAKFPDLPKYMLRAQTVDGLIGIGETYRASEVANLHRNARALVGRNLFSMNWGHLPIEQDREYDGFELLVYDLVGKAKGLPAYQLLGGAVRDRVECSMWTGRRTPIDAARKAFEGKQRGFDCIKYKCNDEDDVGQWARLVRERCGTDMRIIFDPNQRWGDYDTAARFIESLRGQNVVCIEDPITRDLYRDYARLRKLGLPICMHVSLPYCVHGQRIEDALSALVHDAVDGFNFNGPMAAFVRLSELASLAHVPCWHGSEVDLGVLEAGALHAAAASRSCTWPSDIFGRLVREHDLLAAPIVFEGKHALVPMGAGLGVALDADAVERYRSGPDFVLGVE